MSAALPRIRGDREWVIEDGPRPALTCGFCGQTETEWASEPNIGKARTHFALGYLRLPGTWLLGVHPTGRLDVLVDVESALTGEHAGYLPHLCEQIPAEAYERCAEEIAARAAEAS